MRHGWGERLEITYRCDRGLPPGQRCQATTVTTPRDDRPGAALVIAACCGAIALMARAGQRARRELLERAGVEVLEAREGATGSQGSGRRRRCRPRPRRPSAGGWRGPWRPGPWGCWRPRRAGTVARRCRCCGRRSRGSPWSLPAALTVLRWHRGARWAPTLLLVAAAGQALAGDFSSAIALLLVASLGAIGAWFEERTRRREGRWRVLEEGEPQPGVGEPRPRSIWPRGAAQTMIEVDLDTARAGPGGGANGASHASSLVSLAPRGRGARGPRRGSASAPPPRRPAASAPVAATAAPAPSQAPAPEPAAPACRAPPRPPPAPALPPASKRTVNGVSLSDATQKDLQAALEKAGWKTDTSPQAVQAPQTFGKYEMFSVMAYKGKLPPPKENLTQAFMVGIMRHTKTPKPITDSTKEEDFAPAHLRKLYTGTNPKLVHLHDESADVLVTLQPAKKVSEADLQKILEQIVSKPN